jgi:hypothetical protein
MGKFLKGLFVGIGVGLFIAPQPGKETRRMIMECTTAFRKSMLPEADEHFAISTRSPQITKSPVELDQPVATFSTEPWEQVTPSVPPDQPIAMSLSEPMEQVTTSGAPIKPIIVPASEPLEQVTTSVPPAEPVTMSSSEQGTISASPADSESMSSTRNANTTEATRNIADTMQTSGSTTNPHSVPEVNPDQQPLTETPKTDTEDTAKQPTISSPSNRPGQTAKRKTSARTTNPNRPRGQSKS